MRLDLPHQVSHSNSSASTSDCSYHPEATPSSRSEISEFEDGDQPLMSGSSGSSDVFGADVDDADLEDTPPPAKRKNGSASSADKPIRDATLWTVSNVCSWVAGIFADEVANLFEGQLQLSTYRYIITLHVIFILILWDPTHACMQVFLPCSCKSNRAWHW